MNKTLRTNARWLFAALVTAALATAVGGCESQVNRPTPAEYRLYAGVHRGYDGTGYVAVIDCATDSIVDSFPVPTNEILEMTPSADGRLLASNEWIYDLVTRDRVLQVSPPTGAGVFVPGQNEYMAPTIDSTRVYTVQPFGYVRTIPHELLFPVLIPHSTRIVGLRIDDHSLLGPSPLSIYDYSEDRIVDSIFIEIGGGPFLHSKMVASPDGATLFLSGRTGTVAAVDIETKDVRWQNAVSLTAIQVTPDGSEVWVSVPEGYNHRWPSYVIILDAITGAIKDSISLLGYFPEEDPRHEYASLDPRQICFLPTGDKAYVACGHILNTLSQPILVIDTETREVTKLLFAEFKHLIESITIAPQP